MAWAETSMDPSGDHPGRRTWVVAPHSAKGPVTRVSSFQSDTLHTRRVRSSDWVARNLPTGSNTTPFTSPL